MDVMWLIDVVIDLQWLTFCRIWWNTTHLQLVRESSFSPTHTPVRGHAFLQYKIALDVCSVIVQYSVLEWIFWNRFIKFLFLIKVKLRIGQIGYFKYLQWLWLFLHYDAVIHSMRIGHQQTILLISQVLVLLYTKQWTLVTKMPSGSCRQAWSFSSWLLFCFF